MVSYSRYFLVIFLSMYNAYLGCNETVEIWGGKGGGSMSLFFHLGFDKERKEFLV